MKVYLLRRSNKNHFQQRHEIIFSQLFFRPFFTKAPSPPYLSRIYLPSLKFDLKKNEQLKVKCIKHLCLNGYHLQLIIWSYILIVRLISLWIAGRSRVVGSFKSKMRSLISGGHCVYWWSNEMEIFNQKFHKDKEIKSIQTSNSRETAIKRYLVDGNIQPKKLNTPMWCATAV